MLLGIVCMCVMEEVLVFWRVWLTWMKLKCVTWMHLFLAFHCQYPHPVCVRGGEFKWFGSEILVTSPQIVHRWLVRTLVNYLQPPLCPGQNPRTPPEWDSSPSHGTKHILLHTSSGNLEEISRLSSYFCEDGGNPHRPRKLRIKQET